ncbi:MAG: DUF2243 domain-containing protein [Paracoccaceae bacterium]
MARSPWTLPAITLGIALGGFADGILLHQILQWHHLLSLVPGMDDIRLQVLWDGYFHALMYVLAAFGLWGLWRAHRRAGRAPGRLLAGALVIGFGLWHVLDGVLSHWLLGLHRIRVDSANPLFWDLLWFVGFGLAPLVIGWALLQRGGGGAGRAALVGLGLLTIGAGGWALRPPPDQPFTTVVFRPDYGPAQVFAALAAQDARLIWTDAAMGVIVVDVAPEHRRGFYRRGALLVSGGAVPAGCIDWSRPA